MEKLDIINAIEVTDNMDLTFWKDSLYVKHSGDVFIISGSFKGFTVKKGDFVLRHKDLSVFTMERKDFFKCFSKTEDICFVERIKTEKSCLDDKAAKIEAFFETKTFKDLNIAKKGFLKSQLNAMKLYSTILGIRIDLEGVR
ncbi:MAG: crAss001_48 related protein [Treponemataceae bacterium]